MSENEARQMLKDIKRELEVSDDAEDFCIWLADLLKADISPKE